VSSVKLTGTSKRPVQETATLTDACCIQRQSRDITMMVVMFCCVYIAVDSFSVKIFRLTYLEMCIIVTSIFSKWEYFSRFTKKCVFLMGNKLRPVSFWECKEFFCAEKFGLWYWEERLYRQHTLPLAVTRMNNVFTDNTLSRRLLHE
jgi:hypothetical protein